MRDLPFHDSVEGEVGVETARLPSCLGIDYEMTSACHLAVVYCSLLSCFLSGLSRLEGSYICLSGGHMGKISRVFPVVRSAPIPAGLIRIFSIGICKGDASTIVYHILLSSGEKSRNSNLLAALPSTQPSACWYLRRDHSTMKRNTAVA